MHRFDPGDVITPVIDGSITIESIQGIHKFYNSHKIKVIDIDNQIYNFKPEMVYVLDFGDGFETFLPVKIVEEYCIPVGLKPRYIHETERMIDIITATTRYFKSGMEIPVEWIEEYNELIDNISC